MTAELTDLKNKVEQGITVQQSAITLLNGISQKLKDAAEDPDAVRALAAEVEAGSAALSAAVVANTPASTEPPPATA